MYLSHIKQKVRNSLRLKLALLLSLVIAVLTITFTSYYIVNERHTYLAHLTDKGNLLATILADSIQIPLYAGNNEEVAQHVMQILTNKEVSAIKAFNSTGELVAFTYNDKFSPEKSRLQILKAVTSNSWSHTPEALLLGDPQSVQLTGMIELTIDESNLASLTNKMLLGSILIAFAFWFATTSLTFFVFGRVTKTFHQLMEGVKNIETGDFSSRISSGGTDEAGRALAAINSLAEALQKKNEENIVLQAEIVKGLRLQINEEKTKNIAKLIQTNRMTSLGLLVSSMAHEINNPNSSIRLAAEIIERGWKDILPVLDEIARSEGNFKICGMNFSDATEDIEKAVEAILRSSIRIEAVVHNLRTYSLGEREKQHLDFDLNRVAENSVAIVRAHGKMEGIIVDTKLSYDIPAASGNPLQVEQVVTNLLLNAIQAMSLNNGKLINLSTESDLQSGELLLVVSDSGPGIAAADLPHIFEPFYSTRIEKGGSGLGLYISDFIMREQNGTLEISNQESGGCRAEIRLPTAKSVIL